MEKIPPLLLVAIVGYGIAPHVTEFELTAGPYWADATSRHPLVRSTIGVAGTTPFDAHAGFRYGVGYKQGGGPRECISPRPPRPCESGYSRELWDFIDVSMLGTKRVLTVDRVDLRIGLGASVGIPVDCRVKDLRTGTAQECSGGPALDARVLAGAALGYRVTERFDMALHSWYGQDLVFRQRASLALVAGVTYHR